MHTKHLPNPARVPFSQSFKWLLAGWQFFRRAPMVWVIQTLIFITLNLVLTIVPVVGALMSLVLLPVCAAGMVCGCETLERGGELEVRHLFEGLRRSQSNLLLLGGGYVMGAGVILLVAASTAGLSSLVGSSTGVVGALVSALLLGGAMFYVLWVLLLLALWFSPALVVLGPTAPMDAMLLSLRACARNLPAVALLALMIYVLVPIALLPAGLGMLVLMPVIAGAAYAAWRDVFGPPAAPQADRPFAALLAQEAEQQAEQETHHAS